MRKIILTSILSVLAIVASAQIDTINAANNKLQLKNLREGTSTYLVYNTDTLLKKRSIGLLWQRTTKFKTLKDKPVVEFVWKTLFKDTLFSTTTNICDAKTLAPIHHYTNYKSGKVKAYDFADGFIIPIDTIKNNSAIKVGKIKLDIPVLIWEQDLETYPLLPINKVGQKFDISFYELNGKTPKYHRYEVIGKEILQLNSETKVKCWMLKTSDDKGNWLVYWLTDKNKEVVKINEYYNGRYNFIIKQY